MAKKTTKKKLTRKKATKNEKVSEIFKVEKKGEEKTIKKSGIKETVEVEKGQIKKENTQLRNILITIGCLVVIFLIIYFVMNSFNHFEYKGVEFELEKYCDAQPCLTFYKTSIPITYQGEETKTYNFYIRTSPNVLGKIEFDGGLGFRDLMVINSTDEFDCDKDQVIAVANVVNLYQTLGVRVIKDPEAICDEQGRYMFINLISGNTTAVKQTGPYCYNIYIKDCEILKGTERFMLETFVELNNLITD